MIDEEHTEQLVTEQQLAVTLNGDHVLLYDRSQALPEHQQEYIYKMERDMDRGIRLDGTLVVNPDPLQRAQFVAGHLVLALKQNRDAHAAAACSYLAVRIPSLKQVRADDTPAGTKIELVFDQGYQMSVAVSLQDVKASLKTKH